MHDSIQSIGSQVRWKDGDRQVLVRFVWKPPLHRQGLAQKASTSLPEKLTEKDPCCKACPALCARHRGKEWEALLGYGDAALGCDGRVRDVLGAGGLGSGRGGQLASVARVTGQQILREVRLKLVLLFTDPITKCRPSVFLGFFYVVCTILCTSLCQRNRGFSSVFPALPGCPNCVCHIESVGETGPAAQGTAPLLCCPLLRCL